MNEYAWKLLVFTFAVITAIAGQTQDPDYGIHRYQGENAQLLASQQQVDVIFMGDSITEYWPLDRSFPGRTYINRGIAGETTQQMLRRFDQDVIALRPKSVVIFGGTVDLAGRVTDKEIMNHLAKMSYAAKENGIKVFIGSILLIHDHSPTIRSTDRPNSRIKRLNRLIKEFTQKNRFVLMDFAAATTLSGVDLEKGYSDDGVHPNQHGYSAMAKVVTGRLP